jgi:hypothetical protein
MDNQLKDLHETNGYYVQINRIPLYNRVVVQYPCDIVRFPDSKVICIEYEIRDDHVFKKIDGAIASKLLTPEYCSRLLVIADILFTCVKLEINSLLISNFDKDGNKIDDTMKLLDPPESIEQQELEQSLKVIFKKLMVDSSGCENYLANTKEIQEGYSLLLDVFRTGGF